MIGGAESCSSYPVRFSHELEMLIKGASKIKTASEKEALSSICKRITPKSYEPDLTTAYLSEASTGYLPGLHLEKANKTWNISRREQDELALKSHSNAAEAQKKNLFNSNFAVEAPVEFENREKTAPVINDNGIIETNMEKLAKLKPAFVKDTGSLTAGNSSFLTDGAAAALIMPETKAKELGLRPKAYIRDISFTAADPREPFNEMLYGPAYAIPKLLGRHSNLSLQGTVDLLYRDQFNVAPVSSNPS